MDDLIIHSSDDEEVIALKEQLIRAKLKKKRKLADRDPSAETPLNCAHSQDATATHLIHVPESSAHASTVSTFDSNPSDKQSAELPTRPVTPPPRPIAHITGASPGRSPSIRSVLPFASPKRATTGSTLQVASSPSPQKRKPPVSPARVLLGIDKGKTAKDVSLRRTPEKQKSVPQSGPQSKPKHSFNEKLKFARDEQAAAEKRAVTRLKAQSRKLSKFNPVPAFSAAADDSTIKERCSVTGLRIYDRRVADNDAVRCCAAADKTMSIRQLFALASPPDYEIAKMRSDGECEDVVVWGIVAAKTDARQTQDGKAKYSVLQLTDLQMELAVFLYESAFDQHWTLSVGAVVLLLNPQVQKPRPGSGQRLSLKAADGEAVLEIARAADFGICRSMKADGQRCGAWIDASKQDVCDYHIDVALSKQVNKRIEFAVGTRLFDPRSGKKSSGGSTWQPGNEYRRAQKVNPEMERRRKYGVTQHGHSEGGDRVTGYSGGGGLQSNEVSQSEFESTVRGVHRLQREADQRQREREMLAKLMSTTAQSAGHEYFETTDPNGKPADDQADGRMFSAQTLRKIGFDPTKRLFGSVSATAAAAPAGGNGPEDADTGNLAQGRSAADVDLTIKRTEASLKFTRDGLEEAKRRKKELELQAKGKVDADEDDEDDDLEILF
ncbi:hypothetical protein PYCC9005_004147 [Savitreella phatthalungensis]